MAQIELVQSSSREARFACRPEVCVSTRVTTRVPQCCTCWGCVLLLVVTHLGSSSRLDWRLSVDSIWHLRQLYIPVLYHFLSFDPLATIFDFMEAT